MRYWTHALALLAAAAAPRAASAQAPPPSEPPPPAGPTEPPPAPTPAPTATPPRPATPPPSQLLPPRAVDDGAEHRPSELSIAIGLGYRLPTSIQTPNLTSVRLRLASGLTFEPRFVLAGSSQDVDAGPSTTDKSSEIGLGALARFPVVRHGRVDLEVLGGLDVNREATRPETPDMDLTVTTFNASYGVAIGTWINRHWQVSLSAANPVLTNTRRDEHMGLGTSTVTTTRTFGVIFAPSVSVMVHLYH